MHKNPRIFAAAALAAALATAACNTEPEVISANTYDPQAEALKKAPPVQLPPAIRASTTYRCRDNSLVYVNFFADNVTANVRDTEEEPPRVTLKAAAAGQEFVGQAPGGEGFRLSGSGATVTYTSPDSGTQSCRA